MVRSFARHIGKSVQWARKLKREGAPEWQAFVATRQQVLSPVQVPVSETERAQVAMERAWLLYCRAADAAEQGSSVLVEQVALNRAAKEAREQYERARKHYAEVMQEAGQWVPVARVLAMRQAMSALTDLVQNHETAISGHLPDDMRPAFHAAYAATRPAWNAGIKQLDDYLQSLLPVPC